MTKEDGIGGKAVDDDASVGLLGLQEGRAGWERGER